MRRKMYRELGGRSEYLKTPLRELQELRCSLKEEIDYQAEQEAEIERKQKEHEAEMERMKRDQQMQRGRMR